MSTNPAHIFDRLKLIVLEGNYQMNERRYYSQEAEMQAKREIALLTIFALAMGVSIGTVLALLFAPKKGEDIRDDIGKMIESQMGTVEKQIKDIREKVEERISNIT